MNQVSTSFSAMLGSDSRQQDDHSRSFFDRPESDVGEIMYVPSPSPISAYGKQVLSLHVIYDADGTLAGELMYMAKKALGLAHCAACDITHGPRREKPEFTALKTTTGWTVPLLNIHRDEMDETMRACVNGLLPCVVARTDGGDFVLVRPHELDECAGSVDSFVYIIDERAKKMGLQLNRVVSSCSARISPFSLPLQDFDPQQPVAEIVYDDDAVVPS